MSVHRETCAGCGKPITYELSLLGGNEPRTRGFFFPGRLCAECAANEDAERRHAEFIETQKIIHVQELQAAERRHELELRETSDAFGAQMEADDERQSRLLQGQEKNAWITAQLQFQGIKDPGTSLEEWERLSAMFDERQEKKHQRALAEGRRAVDEAIARNQREWRQNEIERLTKEIAAVPQKAAASAFQAGCLIAGITLLLIVIWQGLSFGVLLGGGIFAVGIGFMVKQALLPSNIAAMERDIPPLRQKIAELEGKDAPA